MQFQKKSRFSKGDFFLKLNLNSQDVWPCLEKIRHFHKRVFWNTLLAVYSQSVGPVSARSLTLFYTTSSAYYSTSITKRVWTRSALDNVNVSNQLFHSQFLIAFPVLVCLSDTERKALLTKKLSRINHWFSVSRWDDLAQLTTPQA